MLIPTPNNPTKTPATKFLGKSHCKKMWSSFYGKIISRGKRFSCSYMKNDDIAYKFAVEKEILKKYM